ncbi:MAG TPA: transglycosylase domain-containing protein [Thermoleophilaceae bacterium]|nr:transglycosylase domain-containing protein [Thermoleophilaceae bacterium]
MRRRKGGRAARRTGSGRTRGQRWLLRYGWLLPIGAVLVGGSILVLTYAFASIPLPEDVDYLNSSAEVFDRHGRAIGTFTDEERRFLVDTDELLERKPFIGEAVISSEDRGFYEHNGVSIDGIVRAAWKNLSGGEIREGGSTITQQYVKNTVLTPERTITRKLKEAVLAIKLERQYSKDEILGFYLNTIYLGRGAYGIEAAARSYFDKHADELTLREAAYLAAIIPSPEALDPTTNPVGARKGRDRVLQAMVDEGYITSREAARASRGRVKAIKRASGAPKTQTAAYFMEWLRRDILGPRLGSDLYTGGLKIHTTLDLDMQRYAEEAVAATLTEPTEPQAALVSMTPGGQIRALVGGRDFHDVKTARGFNFATDVGRQPGSAFKPFTLLAAIEEGISTSSRFSGRSPIEITDEPCLQGTEPWPVENYGGSSYGTLDLKQATANSVNTVYAQLIAEIGPDKVADLLEDLGFGKGGQITPYCSLSLGGHLDATALEMARAYAAIDAGGVLPDVTPVTYIEDSQGNCIIEYVPDKDRDCETDADPKRRQVVDEDSAYALTQTLEGVVTSGTAANAVSLPRPSAGKTGTTQDNKDAWYAGYVPQLTTVVWMGYPLDRPKGGEAVVPQMSYCADTFLCRPVKGIEVTGGSFPATIWNAYMTQATAEMEIVDFPIPTDLPDEVINTAPPVTPATVAPTDEATPAPEPTETDIEVTPPPPTPPPPPETPGPGPTILPPSEEPTPQPGDDRQAPNERRPYAYYRRSGR